MIYDNCLAQNQFLHLKILNFVVCTLIDAALLQLDIWHFNIPVGDRRLLRWKNYSSSLEAFHLIFY
jgi:hypothetical protein